MSTNRVPGMPGPKSLALPQVLQARMMEAQVRTCRNNLIQTVIQDMDVSHITMIIAELLSLDCPIAQRYEVLDIGGLLQENSSSLEELARLPMAFTILEKYGRHLMRPSENRSSQWKLIKYSNPIFAEKVDIIKGGRVIMKQMGYTLEISDGVTFPDNVEPSPDLLVRLLVDIMLARSEMEAYFQGHHPHPHVLDDFISDHVRIQIRELVLTGSPSSIPDAWRIQEFSGSLSNVFTAPHSPPAGSYQQRVALVPNKAPPIPARELKPHFQLPMPTQNGPSATGSSDVVLRRKESTTPQTPDYCDICGAQSAQVLCSLCDQKRLCDICDDKWHRHPKRQNHSRKHLGMMRNIEPVARPRSTVVQEELTRQLANRRLSEPVSDVMEKRDLSSLVQLQPNPPSIMFPDKSVNRWVDGPSKVVTPRSSAPSKVVTPNAPSPCHSDDSFYSTEENSPPKPDLEIPASQLDVPNLSIFNSSSSDGGKVPIQLNDRSSNLLPKIISIPDVEKRKAKAEVTLLTLKEDLSGVEQDLMGLVASSATFYEDANFMSLTRRKGTLQRETMILEDYLDNVDSSTKDSANQSTKPPPVKPKPIRARDFGLEDEENQQKIFYPPTSSLSSGPGGPPLESQQHQPTARQPHQSHHQQQSRMQHPSSQPTSPQPNVPSSLREHFNSSPVLVALSPSHTLPAPRAEDPRLIQEKQQNNTMPSKLLCQQGYPRPSFTLPQQDQHSARCIGKSIFYSHLNSTPAEPSDVVLKSLPHGAQEAQQSGNQTAPVAEWQTPHAVPGANPAFRQSWQCEHCTLINQPGTNICSICNRTSDSPTVVLPFTANQQEPDPSRDDSEPAIMGTVSSSVGDRTRRVHEEIEQVLLEKKEAHRRFEAMLEEERRNRESVQNSQNMQIQEQITSANGMAPSVLESGNGEPALSTEAKAPVKYYARQLAHPASPVGSLSSQTPSMSLSPGLGSRSLRGPVDVAQALDAVKQKRLAQDLLIQGKEIIRLLKEADRLDFDPDELQIAMAKCGDENNPVNWLRNFWPRMINTVIAMATRLSQNEMENDVGEISSSEAKEALKQHDGNVEESVNECVKQRKEKFQELMAQGPFPRESILQAMLASKGDIDEATSELQATQLQPFADRIWLNPIDGQPEAALMAAVSQEHDFVANSVISHEDFHQKVKNVDIDMERRIRMVLVEANLQSWGRADAVIRIITMRPEEEFALEDVIEAVRCCGDVPSSLVYLQQECVICFTKYPMNKIRNLTLCQCKLCQGCLSQHFEYVIKERFVKNWSCPQCEQPDIQNDDQAASEHFTFLDMILPTLVDSELRELFQTKLRDWRLMKDPNFRWCAHCGNGFIFNGPNLKMECSLCRKSTCFKCMKPWEDQHDGLTCEQFEHWKFENDPENQAIGLARHLDENGIVCPSCKMRYALAKGGCMHFKCPQCGHEFCSGCLQPFIRNCTSYRSCKDQGLHCHHPRDCFFYLRDNDVKELQSLLEHGGVEFNKDPPQSQENTLICPVMEQKELTSAQMKDEACGKQVQPGHAGLCSVHYKEYLVGLINKNGIDPATLLTSENLMNLLRKLDKEIPAKRGNENKVQYRTRLIKFVKERLPLLRKEHNGLH